MRLSTPCACLVILAAALCGCGCGKARSLYPVSGRVTLNGRPLAGAIVAFLPDDKSSPAVVGVTDDQGRYRLRYRRDETGVLPGRYGVRITTYREASPGTDAPRPAVEEKVPARYNLQSELHVDVRCQANELDFPLRSGP